FSAQFGGQFQGYTLGNVMGAQFYEAALRAVPEVPEKIRQGDFRPLKGWLDANVYRHGAKFTGAELVERATGAALSSDAYVRYLTGKFMPLV
ncbi:hypothetical protein ACKI1S_47975, partial [Streptomyces galilaeus]